MRLYHYIFLLFTVPTLLMTSCNTSSDDDDQDGNWIKFSDYEGDTRSGAVSFVIEEFAYVGLGSDGDDYHQDFWRYDASRNFWVEIAPFPGVGRISAVAFSAGGKGYVGTGFNEDLDTEELDDFWEYDPQSDQWTEIASFEGSARYSAVAFTLDDKGYVGTGYDGSFLKDFWIFDPENGTWSQSISLFGSKRESAFAFVIEGVAYVGAGVNNGQYLYDFWSFDPSQDTWIDLSLNDEDDDYDEFVDAMQRFDAEAFVMGGVAYITCGLAGSLLSDVIAFDPVDNSWTDDFTDFEGSSRSGAVSFVINDQGYVATGRSSTRRHDDIWAFRPFEEYEEFD